MRSWNVPLVVSCLVLAGCSGGGDDAGAVGDGGDPLTGSIQGIVVDQTVAPIEGANVTLTGGPDAGKATRTTAGGLFNLSGLQPGDHFVSVNKPGYRGAQTTVAVVAGEDDPQMARVLLERLTLATPYLDHYKLEGYYDCAYGIVFQTDACDWGYRTVWDEYNHSAPDPLPRPLPLPRTVQRSINTQYIDVPSDTWTIVQEAFWTHETVTRMMISLDETPIDNACDCSPSYMNVVQPSPTFDRLELLGDDGTVAEPAGTTAAARGFIPFAEVDPTTSQAATNLQFVIMTSLFHNYVPDPDWTFETRENYPVG